MDPLDAVRREVDGKGPREEGVARKPRPRQKAARPGFQPSRKKQPQAGEQASLLAQEWYDQGNATGFDFPYDVNYFALALESRIEKDREIQKFLAKGKRDQVDRWIRKMIEVWWNPVDNDGNGGYLTGDVSARNAKDFFLDTDWEDCRDYARSCLRAAYLRQHGRRVPAPIYPDQKEYRERLDELRHRQKVETYVRQVDLDEKTAQARLDQNDRQRLRSFVEKRRKT